MDGPRDPTSGLCFGSRGSCPYDSWLSSLILLTLLSNYSSETIVYAGGVPKSFVVASFGSDAWTQSFFASGSARSSTRPALSMDHRSPPLSIEEVDRTNQWII
jgi:hypothetical protein